MELNFDERRVVGTLIEKGYTTPEQYPLTMNAIVNGSSQKSCRDPVVQLDEERVFLALDSLRKKGLVILVQMQGSRTDRWKHRFGETLGLEDKETAVLGELLLRGPQTDGEIRQRASRMVRLESLEDAGATLAKLAGRTPPLAARLSPEGRRRGVLFAHGLYPAAELEEADYIRTARAKGLSEAVVVAKHTLKNAAIPILTITALQFGTLLGGAVVTETVFAWPGIGRLAVQSIYNRDYPVVQCTVFLAAVMFIAINFVVDLLYGALDPRARAG